MTNLMSSTHHMRYMHFRDPKTGALVATLCVAAVRDERSKDLRRVAAGISVVSHLDRSRASRLEGRNKARRRTLKILRKMEERQRALDQGREAFMTPLQGDGADQAMRWERLQGAPCYNRCAALPAQGINLLYWAVAVLRRWTLVAKRDLDYDQEEARLKAALPKLLEQLVPHHLTKVTSV